MSLDLSQWTIRIQEGGDGPALPVLCRRTDFQATHDSEKLADGTVLTFRELTQEEYDSIRFLPKESNGFVPILERDGVCVGCDLRGTDKCGTDEFPCNREEREDRCDVIWKRIPKDKR